MAEKKGATAAPPESPPVRNLFHRIIEVYNAVQTVVKDRSVSMGGETYKAVTHDMVTKALHVPIAEAGIVVLPTQLEVRTSEFSKQKATYVQLWYRADVRMSLTLINADNPEERITTESSAYAFDTSDKAVGKAYSLATKAAYLKLFNLESTDNEEDRDFEKDDGAGRQNGQGRQSGGNSRPQNQRQQNSRPQTPPKQNGPPVIRNNADAQAAADKLKAQKAGGNPAGAPGNPPAGPPQNPPTGKEGAKTSPPAGGAAPKKAEAGASLQNSARGSITTQQRDAIQKEADLRGIDLIIFLDPETLDTLSQVQATAAWKQLKAMKV